MSADFDEMVSQLQEKILDEARKIYSREVIELFLHPQHVGRIHDVEAYGKVTGPCGDTMEIYLTIKDDRIADAQFMTDGCGTTLACGSTITALSIGKTIPEAMRITSTDILNRLGGLPEADQHCSVLAVTTFQEAIKNHVADGSHSWQGLYTTK
jgi:nitrogen fixation NifU-like protein